MEWFNNLKISTKILTATVIGILLMITITVGASLYYYANYNTSVLKVQLSNSLEGLDIRVEEQKDAAKSYAVLFSEVSNVITSIEQSDTDFLIKTVTELEEQTNLDFVVVTDDKGKVIMRSHEPDIKGDSISDQKHIELALKGTNSVEFQEGSNIKFAIQAGAPIKNEQGKIIGTMSVGYNISNNKLTDLIKNSYDTEATIFAKDVRVSTTIIQDGKRLVGTKLDPKIVEKVLTQKQAYNGSAEILGVPYLTAY
jgi:methyl-accepting chemotaxis protein